MPKAGVEVSSTFVCAWKAARSRKPSAVWAERFRVYSAQLQLSKERNIHQPKANRKYNGKRYKETDKHIRHLATTFTGISYQGTLHQFGKGNTLSQMYQLWGKGKKTWNLRLCQFFGWLWTSGQQNIQRNDCPQRHHSDIWGQGTTHLSVWRLYGLSLFSFNERGSNQPMSRDEFCE